MGLCRELSVRPLNNSIYRASLLAETAVDALRHVDVIPGKTAETMTFSLMRKFPVYHRTSTPHRRHGAAEEYAVVHQLSYRRTYGEVIGRRPVQADV